MVKPHLPLTSHFVFLVLLPVLNSAFISSVLLITDQFSWLLLSHVLIRVWLSCFSAWLLVTITDHLNRKAGFFETESLQYFAIKNSIAALLALTVFLSLLPVAPETNRTNQATPVGLTVITALQLIIAIAIRYGFAQQKKRIYLKTQYQLAQYTALKAQLNPHFLFNTLNLLSAEIKDNPDVAMEIVDELSELLRNVLSQSSALSVPFGLDIDWLEHYFFIQKLRFEDRIKVTQSIDEGCREIKVPPLILQPIVENCFVHGFGKENANLHIEIIAKLTEDQLNISVKDNGVGFEMNHITPGHGLKIVEDSLMLLYDQKAHFKMTSQEGLGTRVDLFIPRGA